MKGLGELEGDGCSVTPNSPKHRGITRAICRSYTCGELGHIEAQCPNIEEPMQCSLGDCEDLCGLINLVRVAMTPHRYTWSVRMNGIETIALVDSRIASHWSLGNWWGGTSYLSQPV